MLYFDTSALAKRYLTEPGSGTIERVVLQNADWMFTSVIAYAETLATLARALRERRVSRKSYQQQKAAFKADWEALHVIELAPEVFAPADRLIERYGLRGFDAIHLCSALWIGKPDFVCFDERLRRAAVAETLVVVP